jgi:hypothetical protein
MRRFALAVLALLLWLPAQAAMAQSGARAEQPVGVKGDREKVKVQRPAGLEDREDAKRPAGRLDRDDIKQPAVTAEPKPAEHPIAEPKRETKARHAKPSRHKATALRHARARARHTVARGTDAQVLRARKAWLRALAHKYGYSHW